MERLQRNLGVALVFTAMLAGTALSVSGCSHPFTIKNMSSYTNMGLTSLDQRLTIGITPSTDDIHCDKLLKGVGEALGRCGADVLLPYSQGSSRHVDVLAHVSIRAHYEGSGWNFLINFPGFLIFTPAWHGYNYGARYDVQVDLKRATDNKRIDSLSLPIKLDIRHAAMNRTWTEVSWFEVGAIALVGGIIFTQYDDNVSPLIADKIKGPIGDYIAQEIVTRINNSGAFGRRTKRANQGT